MEEEWELWWEVLKLVDKREEKRYLYLIFMNVKKQQLKDMHDYDKGL